ncbi:CHASE domain-containing protein [bacterium]|nr:CHASE domain-containing protein [bacterium]
MIIYKNQCSLSDIFCKPTKLLIIIPIGLSISLFTFMLLRTIEKNKLREKFFNIAEYQAKMVQNAVNNQIFFLNSLHNFFEASQYVDYDEFELFVNNMLSNKDEITSVYWAPKIKFADKDQFEKTASLKLSYPFSITQRASSGDFIKVTPRDEYFPIYYAVPKKNNKRLNGFDLSTNYLCKKAIYNSVKSDSITASEQLSLLDKFSRNKSLFLFQPVYQKNYPKKTMKERLNGLQGLLVIVLNINTFKKNLSAKSFTGLKVNFYDILNPLRKKNIFSMSSNAMLPCQTDRPDYLGSNLEYMTDIIMAGRHYLFYCEPEKSFFASESTISPILVLLSGILITLSLSRCYVNMSARTKQIEKLVKIRTDKLTQSEQKYRILFESSKDAIILFHQEVLIDFNISTLNIFGFCSKSQLINKTLPDFFSIISDPQEDFFRINEYIIKSAKNKHLEFEMSFRKFGGSVFIGEVVFQSFGSGGHHILQVSIKDITERKKMEEELIKSRKFDSIGVLASGMAHDFNNLLTSIIGNIALCKMDTLADSPLMSFLLNTEKAAGIAKELSQQLLTITKNKAPLKTVGSIKKLIKDTVKFTLQGANVKHSLFFEKNLFPVKINETQISSVINNVTLNALQAMPQGGKIDIRCENIKNKDTSMIKRKCLKISITDTGIGIPEENLKKIFDPYFTTKEKTTDKGSGLGLTTSYSIIKKHGGQMTVRSIVNKGTTIEIFIPAHLSETKHDRNSRQANIAGILIMDNGISYKKELEKILNGIGCKIKICKYGKEAFKLYEKSVQSDNPFDAVILDSSIALEAIENLLRINPNAKTIITALEKNYSLTKEYDEYGLNNVVSHPYSEKEIKSALEQVLER